MYDAVHILLKPIFLAAKSQYYFNIWVLILYRDEFLNAAFKQKIKKMML